MLFCIKRTGNVGKTWCTTDQFTRFQNFYRYTLLISYHGLWSLTKKEAKVFHEQVAGECKNNNLLHLGIGVQLGGYITRGSH